MVFFVNYAWNIVIMCIVSRHYPKKSSRHLARSFWKVWDFVKSLKKRSEQPLLYFIQHLFFFSLSPCLCFLSLRSNKEGEESFSAPVPNPFPELITSTLSPLVSQLLPWTKSSTTQVSAPFIIPKSDTKRQIEVETTTAVITAINCFYGS